MDTNFHNMTDAIANKGIIPPTTILCDGRIHRFGKHKSSWYVAFQNPNNTIVFGDWKLGIKYKFIESDEPLSGHQKQRVAEEIRKTVLLRQQELEASNVQAAIDCNRDWADGDPAINNPYLKSKHVLEYRLRESAKQTLIPVTDGYRIHSLQRISPDGVKRFHPGGKVAGHFFPIGVSGKPKELFICEGIATGLTIYQLQDVPVIVAFNAGNLTPVAEKMRWKYPGCHIVIAGDNDAHKPGNPGKAAAELAAIRSGSDWIVPDFTGLSIEGNPTDFNDLAVLRGDL